jgi:hypothetical protein
VAAAPEEPEKPLVPIATGAAMALWLALVFLGDLGLIGATLTLRPNPANPMATVIPPDPAPMTIVEKCSVVMMRSPSFMISSYLWKRLRVF